MDFTTSINVPSDKAELMMGLLRNGQFSAVAKLSRVEIKRGEGVKRNWSTGPVEVTTYITKRKEN